MRITARMKMWWVIGNQVTHAWIDGNLANKSVNIWLATIQMANIQLATIQLTNIQVANG